jgi:hypothetical protein
MPPPSAERSAPIAQPLDPMAWAEGTMGADAASSGDDVVVPEAPSGGCALAMKPAMAPLLACRAIDRA